MIYLDVGQINMSILRQMGGNPQGQAALLDLIRDNNELCFSAME